MATALSAVGAVRPRVSIRAVVTALAVIVVVSGGLGAGVGHLRSADAAARARAADEQAVATLRMPTSFTRVSSAWGCVSNARTACFTSQLDGAEAVRAAASALGARGFSTTLGHGGVQSRYGVCASVGSSPAFALVSARPANAVQHGNLWAVPEGQAPHYQGSVVDLILTDRSRCP